MKLFAVNRLCDNTSSKCMVLNSKKENTWCKFMLNFNDNWWQESPGQVIQRKGFILYFWILGSLLLPLSLYSCIDMELTRSVKKWSVL